MEDDLELSAVWGSSLQVSSQVSLKSEDLQEVHVVQEVQEMVRVISDEEVDNDRFLRGLLQQERRGGSNMDHFNREREVDNDE